MTATFVTADLWPTLRRLGGAKSSPAYIAVPFIGPGAANRLRLRGGDSLVTRFDDASIRGGLVDPREIVRFLKRGVEVHAVSNLHAKVFVRGRMAVVGSANLSSSSENDLLEAGVVVSTPGVVAACRAFVRGLRGDPVELEFARRQVSKYRPPSTLIARGKRVRRGRKVITHTGLVAVVLNLIEYDDSDERALTAAEEVAERHRSDRSHFALDSFRFAGPMPRALRVGERVLILTRRGRRGMAVSAPARILALRKYRSARGAVRIMFVTEVRKFQREKSLTDVIQRVGALGDVLRRVRGVRVIRSGELVYRIGQVWPKVA